MRHKFWRNFVATTSRAKFHEEISWVSDSGGLEEKNTRNISGEDHWKCAMNLRVHGCATCPITKIKTELANHVSCSCIEESNHQRHFFLFVRTQLLCLRYTSLLLVPEGVLFVILPPLHLSVRCPFLSPGSCIPHYPLELTTFKRNSSPLTILVLLNFGLLVLYFTIVISRVQ